MAIKDKAMSALRMGLVLIGFSRKESPHGSMAHDRPQVPFRQAAVPGAMLATFAAWPMTRSLKRP
jgi:hypothetical protein